MQMKKLRLLAVRDVKEELLRELIRRGCVEISELEGEIEGTELEGLLHRESTDVSALRSKHAALVHAVELLDVYAPKKTKLLAAKPELEDRVLLDDTGLTGALKVAEAIESSDARIKRIAAEESRQRSVIESLQPWLGLDLPLDFEGTERCGVLLGTMPGRIQLADAEAAIAQVDEEAELFSVRSDKKEHDVLLVCMKGQLPAMQDALRPFGFTPSPLTSMHGTARECLLNAEQSLKELAAEKENCTRYIVDDAVHRDELKLAADRVSVKIALAEAEDRLCGTDSVVAMEGWIPAEREQEIALAEAHNRAVQQKMNAVSERFIPGTYEGSAQGFGGVIRVSVTVNENEITEIEVLSSPGEDAAYFSQAETLNAKILQRQSTDLDAVTGATLSSIGLLDAVDAALEQAVK